MTGHYARIASGRSGPYVSEQMLLAVVIFFIALAIFMLQKEIRERRRNR